MSFRLLYYSDFSDHDCVNLVHQSINKSDYHFKCLQQHVSALESGLQAEYKAVYTIECHYGIAL